MKRCTASYNENANLKQNSVKISMRLPKSRILTTPNPDDRWSKEHYLLLMQCMMQCKDSLVISTRLNILLLSNPIMSLGLT